MKSGACGEMNPTISAFLLGFLLLSPVFSTMNFNNFNQTMRSNNESKKMKLIKATLKKINKPFVKSIKSPDGDIIDCVLFHLQPAFDDPLLKATMLLDPPEIPNGNKKRGMETEVTQLWSSNGESCPQGTIPIRRQTEGDILRSNSVSNFGKKIRVTDYSSNGHEHAIGFVRGGEYYGAKAKLNVWAPNVTDFDEFSVSQMWVTSEVPNHFANTVEAGWQVFPTMYGNDLPRFFTYWTNDGYYRSGCYDLLCSGFVQTTHEFCLGASIDPISTYNGSQFDITILIWKDPNQKNWYLMVGSIVVGYWPATLFPDLQGPAAKIEVGGEVYTTQTGSPHTQTKMGSGHFSDEGFGKAAYVHNIEMVDQHNIINPVSNLEVYAQNPNCYNVRNGFDSVWGNYILFGGPGNNPNCP